MPRTRCAVSRVIFVVALLSMLRVALPIFVRASGAPDRLSHSGQGLSATGSAGEPEAPSDSNKQKLNEAYGDLPLRFERNEGQTSSLVRFSSRGPGYELFLTPSEAALVLSKPLHPTTAPHESENSKEAPKRELPRGERTAGQWHSLVDREHGVNHSEPRTEGVAIGMRFDGSNPVPVMEEAGELPGVTNYFLGNDPHHWRTGIHSYGRVVYHDLYPGINLDYYGANHRLEYDLTVSPYRNPGAIKLSFRGARRISQEENGDLLLTTDAGVLRQLKPLIYQQSAGGERQTIPGSYVIAGRSSVLFKVGPYDRSRPLVIDPILSYSTYLGGTSPDNGSAIAVDAEGNAYVTGTTQSSDFSTTPGAFSTTFPGGQDSVFVTKMNSTGTALVYSTFLGGTSFDFGSAIAVDASGHAFVAGYTASSNFPTTPGAYQTANGKTSFGYAAFVTEMNTDGNALIYSTYLGGSANDYAFGIAIDPSGSAYVTGATSSSNFPTSSGAFQPTLGGGIDAFITKLNPSGAALVYSSFLGGTATDEASAIAVDGSGDAFVVGGTSSAGFPTTPGAFQPVYAGEVLLDLPGDAFVSEVNPTGTALVYSTFLGGSASEIANAIALDSSGNAYITGQTNSINYPTTPGVLRGGNGGPFKSLNSGGSWGHIGSGFTDPSVQSFAIDPTNPSNLYAGTESTGVFKSTNGGAFLGDNGLHGFSIPTPSELKDGAAHTVHVEFGTSTTDLSGSPFALTCAGNTATELCWLRRFRNVHVNRRVGRGQESSEHIDRRRTLRRDHPDRHCCGHGVEA
jgi:hypothetical protein